MKKNTLKNLVAYLNGENITNIDEIKAELQAELDRGEAKAQANRDLYDATKDTVLDVLSDTPITVAELWEEIKDDVPQGMTKSKVQYGLRELWASEVVKIEGKVNSYRKA